MNKVILMGRLTRDAEVRYSQGENAMAIARFTIAVDRRAREPSSFSKGGSRQAVIRIKMDSAFTPPMLWQRTWSLQRARILPVAEVILAVQQLHLRVRLPEMAS